VHTSVIRILCLLGLLLPAAPIRAQVIDTTGGRYHQPVFPQITVTRAIPFGQAPNYSGQNQTLLLDFYEPAGDSALQRPLIVFAHEGGFVGGTRNDAFCIAFATRLARLGYCVASIDYRVLFFPFDTTGLATAALRAMQDMRGAIRFFRADAAGANVYRVNPAFIVAAGSSAGGVTALQTAYLDKPAEVPSYLNAGAIGGLEGTSGPAGYSSRPQAVVSLSGAMGRVGWLEPADIPVCFVHGTADAVVPYGRGTAGAGLPPLRVYGPGVLKPRADAVGTPATLRTLQRAGHVPYNSSAAYADTTFRTVRDFLRPLLVTTAPLGRTPDTGALPGGVYPVPATETLQLRAPEGQPFAPREVDVVEASTGRLIRRFRWSQPRQTVMRNGLPAGVYFLRDGQQTLARMVWE